MHAAIRPLVTTGVALVGAAVIVGNPIALPTPNVAIRADQAAADTHRGLYLLDPIFLASIAVLNSQPTDPMESVPHLLAALTDGGPPVSREAIEAAYAAGVAVVSGPTQGAASVPNLPAGVGSSNNPLANPTVNFQQTLAKLVEDANDVGAQVVASAFAAGAVAAAMPTLIASTVTSAATGDLTAALNSAVSAVIAPIGPPAMVVDAVRTVIENQVAEVTGTAPPAAAPEVAVQSQVHEEPVAQSLASAGESASGTAESRQAAAGTTEAGDQAAPEGAGPIEATPSADDNGIVQEDTTTDGATDLTDGNKVEPGTEAQSSNPIITSIERVAEELRRLAGQRVPGAGTGSAGSGTDGPSGPAGASGGSGSGGSGG
jgi:hypothetical protein